jgi:hypothetical protein
MGIRQWWEFIASTLIMFSNSIEVDKKRGTQYPRMLC